MENYFTPTKQKYSGIRNLFNFTYKGKKYKVNFFQENNEDQGWFAGCSDGNQCFDFYSEDKDGVDPYNLSNWATMKGFIETIEKLALESRLHILPDNK